MTVVGFTGENSVIAECTWEDKGQVIQSVFDVKDLTVVLPSVKDIPASELEMAIANVIANLTGKECSVSISEIGYSSDGFTSHESLSFSAVASCRPKETGEKLPF